MPNSSSIITNKQRQKFTYHTDERDQLSIMAEKYKCSPFTGECYTQEVSLQKIGKTYHIILSEQQMNEFGDDFIIEETVGRGKHRSLLMIKPTMEDNHYIFFRRKEL